MIDRLTAIAAGGALTADSGDMAHSLIRPKRRTLRR